MKTLNYRQGSEEWLAERARYRTASEASVMMGCGAVSRSEMLRMKATGDEKEYSRWTLEVLFARGHEVEALARLLAEAIVGEELFPVTATDDEGYLLASFDGVTMDESVIWECKQWNEDKAAAVRAGVLPESDRWQVIQQLVVSRAKRCLYMVTDGTQEKTVFLWVELRSDFQEYLLAGWAQFDADLANYAPTADAPVVVGRAPDALPALLIEVTGLVKSSNLEAFRDRAVAVFAGISTELSTDADFANAAETVKWCQDIEAKLKLAKEQALGQTQSIDELFRAIDAISAEARTKRLELDKRVEKRKKEIRDEILAAAKASLQAHMVELNAGFSGVVTVPVPAVDFPGVMKGKRNITSLRDAADTEAARAKVDASQVAARMQTCLSLVRAEPERAALFPDLQSLVMKAPDDLAAVIKSRISDADAAEAKRAEQKRLADEEAEEHRIAAQKIADDAKAEAATRIALAAAQVAPVVAPSPAPVVAPESVALVPPSVPIARTHGRPSYAEIEIAVATHFGVDLRVARAWLIEIMRGESHVA